MASVAVPTAQEESRPSGGQRPKVAPYAFVVPAVVTVALLLYAPFVWTLFLSFTRYHGLGAPHVVGIANYRDFLSSPQMLTSLRNTLLWVVGTLLLPVGLGLAVAVLTHGTRAARFFRLPFLLPYALSGAAVAVVWSFILQSGGALNQALSALGLPGGATDWLQDSPTSTVMMIVAFTWQSLGVDMLLFVVGLQSIPREPIEAAMIDGASGWRLFRHVTWPLLRPITTVVVGLSLVGSLKTFDIVWVTTHGGPGRTSETLAVTMYRDALVAQDYGYGSAIAVLLCLVTGLGSLLYLRRQLRTIQ